MEANIANVQTQEEADFLKTLATVSQWLNMRKNLKDQKQNGGYHWRDGGHLYIEWTNWALDNPDGKQDAGSGAGLEVITGDSCLVLSQIDAKWYDGSCDKPASYTCKKQAIIRGKGNN